MDSQNGSTRRVMGSSRDKSPERARAALTRKQQSKVVVGTVRRRVQVVYYLTRNGQLEHPHFMELSLLPNQHLRLKDVMDRLTALRGKGMPSLYSWSSKRNYKNGYVWNDLLENDVVLPTDGGAEYVLKGSEIVESSNATSESFRQHHLTRDNKSMLPPTRPRSEDEDEYEEEEEKQSYDTSSTTPRSRCSRGVSTEELEETQKSIAELTLGGHESDHSPPPPSSASSNPSGGGGQGGGDEKKDDDNDPVDLSISRAILPSRNSLLLQLIACGGGGSGVTMKKCARKNIIRKEVLTRNINTRTRKIEEEVNNEDRDMIRCMSENPRFGNFQAEEKEYFSGSIVESMSSDQSALPQPLLKRSNSYHDQQQRTLKIGSDEEVEEEKREKLVKGKCIPLMKSCASKHF